MFLVDAYRVMAEKGAAAMLQQPGRRVMTDKWQVAKAPARRQSRRSGGFATASAHDLPPCKQFHRNRKRTKPELCPAGAHTRRPT